MLDKAALAFIYFSIFIAVPAVFVKNKEWKCVISCKLNNNIGSIYCFAHKFTSTWGEGQLTPDGSTQNALTLFHCFVHLVPRILVVVCLAYFCLRYQLQVSASRIHAWCRSLSCDIDIGYGTAVHHLRLRGTWWKYWCPPPCLAVNIHRTKGSEYGFYVAMFFFAKICCPQFPGFGVSRNHRTGTKALFLTLCAVGARPDPLWSPAFCVTDVAVRTMFAWPELMPIGLLQLVAHGVDYIAYGFETWRASDCLRT